MRRGARPMRVFTVTGNVTAARTACTSARNRSGSRSNPAPAPRVMIFGTGQPALRSIRSNRPSDSTTAAAFAITAGSCP